MAHSAAKTKRPVRSSPQRGDPLADRYHRFSPREDSALGIGRCRAHNSLMNKLHYERADYSVGVKNRAPPPKAWRWEIYRAGNAIRSNNHRSISTLRLRPG